MPSRVDNDLKCSRVRHLGGFLVLSVLLTAFPSLNELILLREIVEYDVSDVWLLA